MARSLRISLGGRLAVEVDGVAIDEQRFQGRQGRVVFACLVAEVGRPVPREQLAEAVWGETPPVTWEKGLTVIVSKLRGLLTECGLDGPRILTSAYGCYRLELPTGTWVDIEVAAAAAEEAQRALDRGSLARAEAEAGRAVELARRRFLPGEEGAWVDERRRQLAGVLTTAVSSLYEADLRSGRPAEAVVHAEELIALEPFRESGYRRAMEAHTAAGNGAEALRVYEQCRQLLADELGAFPSPETEAAYRELLRAPAAPAAAPAVDAPSRAATVPQSARRRTRPRALLVAGGAVVAAAASAVVLVAWFSGNARPVVVAPNSIAVVDPHTNRVVADIPVGSRPTAVAVGRDAVWVANADDGTVSRIDPRTRKVVTTIGIGAPAIGLAVDRGTVWLANGTGGTVALVDARANVVAETIDLRGPNAILPNSVYAVAAAGNAVWAAAGYGSVIRLDRQTHEVAAKVDVGEVALDVAVGEGATWVADNTEHVVRIETATNTVTARVAIASMPVAIAAGENGVWVVTVDGSLWRVDPETASVTATIPVGKRPLGVAADDGSVWVANAGDGTLSRIDPDTNRVVATITLAHPATAVAAADGLVWVAVAREPIT
jgi:YVTN family beta-propeller protein